MYAWHLVASSHIKIVSLCMNFLDEWHAESWKSRHSIIGDAWYLPLYHSLEIEAFCQTYGNQYWPYRHTDIMICILFGWHRDECENILSNSSHVSWLWWSTHMPWLWWSTHLKYSILIFTFKRLLDEGLHIG